MHRYVLNWSFESKKKIDFYQEFIHSDSSSRPQNQMRRKQTHKLTNVHETLPMVENQVIFYTYIRTELIRIFDIISVILNEFSYGKAEIPHRFL